MSLCARAVALWLAACALAAQAQAERIRPQCTDSRCQFVTEDNKHFIYTVNGKTLRIKVTESLEYYAECDSISIDDPKWPRYNQPIYFKAVVLMYCPLDAPALKTLNVTFTQLYQYYIPSAKGSTASLAELPRYIEKLTLSAGYQNLIVLEPGALDSFAKLRNLMLLQVQLDPLPMHLDDLFIWDTGVETLPRGANNVVKLAVREMKMKSIRIKNPRLHFLTIHFRTAVESLVLEDVASEVLQNNTLDLCIGLQELEVRRVHVLQLPAFLLRKTTLLTHFTFTDGHITTLPKGLFSRTPRLQFVDVSRNFLDTLPRELFSGLPELRVLRLADNRLGTRDLQTVAPWLASLTALDFGGNPLGNLCPVGPENATLLSAFSNLREVSLARTNASHICDSWLHELKYLRHFNFSGNNVSNLSCAKLHAPIGLETESVTLDLTKNPLEQFDCSRDGPSTINGLPPKKINLLITPGANCNCSCSVVQCFLIYEGMAYGYDVPTERQLLLKGDAASIKYSLATLQSSLKELSLTTYLNTQLMLEPGALALPALNGLRSLYLWRVQGDRLPPNLDYLHLENTGYVTLPPEAFNVVTLEIREDNLTTISGSAPRLRSLELYNAPALVSLVLEDTLPELLQNGLIDQEEPLPEKWIETVEFRRSRALAIPTGLLLGAWDLTTFRFTDGNITTVPSGLFHHNTHLEVVDFRDNKLESIPGELFLGLTKLRELNLEDNNLSAQVIRKMAPLSTFHWFSKLALSGNPLGDLCPDGTEPFLSSLQNLQELYLARTGASRICRDWLRNINALQLLDLNSNDIQSVSCEDFREYRMRLCWEYSTTVINLEGNPVEEFNCSQDSKDAVDDLSRKKVEVLVDSFLECNCNCPYVWQCVEEKPVVTVGNQSLDSPNTQSSQQKVTEMRAVTEYLVVKNMTLTQVNDELEKVYKDSAPSYSTVKKWAAAIKHGIVSDDERIKE